MRRCGRISCLVGTGLLVATLAAGGALAAPGGQGKGLGREGNPGKGLALAKGHAKRAPAAPQPAEQPAKPRPAKKPSPPPSGPSKRAGTSGGGNGPPPGATTRHHHLTICHATGSGRYIVITPNVNGVLNGHLMHHDDFIYTGSCSRPSGSVGGPPPESRGPRCILPVTRARSSRDRPSCGRPGTCPSRACLRSTSPPSLRSHGRRTRVAALGPPTSGRRRHRQRSGLNRRPGQPRCGASPAP
jgi:hypothetical protein